MRAALLGIVLSAANGVGFAAEDSRIDGLWKYSGLDAFVKLCGTTGVTIVNADGKQPAKPDALVSAILK